MFNLINICYIDMYFVLEIQVNVEDLGKLELDINLWFSFIGLPLWLSW